MESETNFRLARGRAASPSGKPAWLLTLLIAGGVAVLRVICGCWGQRRRQDGGSDLGALDLVAADLGQQGGVAQPQLARRAGLVPAVPLQRLGDHAALERRNVAAERL